MNNKFTIITRAIASLLLPGPVLGFMAIWVGENVSLVLLILWLLLSWHLTYNRGYYPMDRKSWKPMVHVTGIWAAMFLLTVLPAGFSIAWALIVLGLIAVGEQRRLIFKGQRPVYAENPPYVEKA